MPHNRITHYKDSDIHFEGEAVDDSYFLHLNVENYSHNIQKKIDALFREFAEASVEVGWPKYFFCYIANRKYAEFMGGEFIGEHPYCGKNLGVYVWDPQHLL